MAEEQVSKSKYALKASADATIQRTRYAVNTRANRKDRRKCSSCKRSAAGRKQHLFVGLNGRSLFCGACKRP